MRTQVERLLELGKFPASKSAVPEIIREQQALLLALEPPLTDDEAKRLIQIFGNDDYYGLAWTLLHLIETAPNWPIEECLLSRENEWIDRLHKRVQRARQKRGRPHE